MVYRLAPSWFRIGSLEILAKSSEIAELNQLIDFLLENHFDHVKQENRDDWIIAMFAAIVDSTAQLGNRVTILDSFFASKAGQKMPI